MDGSAAGAMEVRQSNCNAGGGTLCCSALRSLVFFTAYTHAWGNRCMHSYTHTHRGNENKCRTGLQPEGLLHYNVDLLDPLKNTAQRLAFYKGTLTSAVSKAAHEDDLKGGISFSLTMHTHCYSYGFWQPNWYL